MDQPSLVSSLESLSVPPRREFGAEGISDPDQLETLGQPGETDVVGGHPDVGPAEVAFALLDRLPAILERGEVPPAAGTADHPEAAPGLVVGDAPTDREVFDLPVGGKGSAAEETGGEQRSRPAGDSVDHAATRVQKQA